MANPIDTGGEKYGKKEHWKGSKGIECKSTGNET
jgi:hypothetical protein